MQVRQPHKLNQGGIQMDKNSLAHTTWECKYHIVFAPKYGNRHFWCRGYYIDTVGKNAKKIEDYILLHQGFCYKFAAKNPQACLWDESRLKHMEII